MRSLRAGLYLLIAYVCVHSLAHAPGCVTRPELDLKDAGQ